MCICDLKLFGKCTISGWGGHTRTHTHTCVCMRVFSYAFATTTKTYDLWFIG